jgi:hypothetical protein
MRAGLNPSRSIAEPRTLPELGIGVLNYIPNQSGYFSQSLDILKLCLASIRAHTPLPHYLMVIDNGSCPEVQAALRQKFESGRIDALILESENFGVCNGTIKAIRACPGKYVLFTDGDIYYRPGWFEAHRRVADAFPNVGLVGGYPMRHLADFHTRSTHAYAATLPAKQVARGQLIADDVMADFAKTVAGDSAEARLADWRQQTDTRIEKDGVTAYVGASHMQFLLTRPAAEVVRFASPYLLMGKSRPEGPVAESKPEVLDGPIDEAGLLRLSTPEPFVYHMGNRLTEEWLRAEYSRLVGVLPAHVRRMPRATPTPILRHRMYRRLLRKLYMWSYRQYESTLQ